jgi:predicted acyl esterase
LGAARLREGKTEPGPSSAAWAVDGIVELSIQLDDTAVRLDVGESLRLDIASSAFPLLARHPNTMTSPNRVSSPSAFSRALQTVYHDDARPSSLTFPVLPSA